MAGTVCSGASCWNFWLQPKKRKEIPGIPGVVEKASNTLIQKTKHLFEHGRFEGFSLFCVTKHLTMKRLRR